MDGAWNMACDLWLMESARDSGDGILRIYSWTRPTISFGRNERICNFFSSDILASSGLDAVRRPTGGRALLHSREVTYAVALPLDSQTSWQAAYDSVNQVLLSAMRALGVPAMVVTSENAKTSNELPNGAPCFAGASRGEIAVRGAKLVASAVWRDRAAYLQHGSILLHDDQLLLLKFASSGMPRPEPAAVLSEYFPGATLDSVADAIAAAVGGIAQISSWSLSDADIGAIMTVRERLAQSSWLWRS